MFCSFEGLVYKTAQVGATVHDILFYNKWWGDSSVVIQLPQVEILQFDWQQGGQSGNDVSGKTDWFSLHCCVRDSGQ